MIRRNSSLTAGIAIIILCLPMLAGATAPQRVSYQGRLTDVSGNPIPDNPALLVTFNIYPTEVGPGTLWTEAQSVPVKSGLFSVELGAITPLTNTVFTDSVRWLGVTVGGSELVPRTRLISAPYSYRVGTVDGASGGTIVGNVAATGMLSSGTPTQDGGLEVYVNGFAQPAARIGYDPTGPGGGIWLSDESHHGIGRMEADGNETGGYFEISSGAIGQFFTVDGNWAGTQETRVTLTGSTQSVSFQMDQTGDAAVVLPVDAVNASEILDEPGVAAALNGSTAVLLTGVTQTLLSRTITLPAAGYVLAIGTCQPIVSHVTGTTTSANFGVSTSSVTWPVNQDIGIQLPSALPTGLYNWPVTAQTVFTLSAGVNTVYFLADQGTIGATGSINVWDMQLSLIYIPTSYGTVSALAGTALPDDITTPVTSETADLEAERLESVESNNARIAHELAAMKAELETVKKQLEQGNRNNQRD
jgi:hypothetical protein